MSRYKDLSNQRFGKLIVKQFVGKDKHRRALWECECECGNKTTVASPNLIRGYTKSCGCLFEQNNRGLTVDENGKTLKLYYVWSSMRWIPMDEQGFNRRFNQSKSGVRGVSFHEASGKWYARVTYKRKVVYQELFSDFEEACEAVKMARSKIYNNEP